MFAYCENNPTNKVDKNGTNPAAVLYAAFVVIIFGIVIVCIGEIAITAMVPALQKGAASLYDSISGSINKAKDKSKERSKSPSLDNKRKQNGQSGTYCGKPPTLFFLAKKINTPLNLIKSRNKKKNSIQERKKLEGF